MSKREVFDNLYKNLNIEQKEAVDTIEGPVMVVAGPGTGKTQILTLRIANILLKTQVNGSNILALTFTQAASTNMRQRLHKIIGHEAHHVNIFTFHAFCAHLIEEHPDDFWDMLGMRLVDDVEKTKILEDILDSEDFRIIKPFRTPYHHVSNVIKAIADLKREGIDPEELEKIIIQERQFFDSIPDKESKRIKGSLKTIYRDQLNEINKNKELQILYMKYQKLLEEKNVYDYDDLIMSILNKLKTNQDFGLRLMEQYQYILVDEHQDSNNAQNKIIKYLTSYHDNPNIFVVGDEKQAIFRFQGASVENFRSFREMYKDANIVTLSQNYRSPQTILDSAIQLLGAVDQNLLSQTSKVDEPIRLREFSTPQMELNFLRENIQKNITDGIPPHEIAVMTRTRMQAKQVLRVLTEANVPAYADLSEDVLEENITQKLLIILEAVHKYADETTLFNALHLDIFGLPPLDLYKLSQASSRRRMSLSDILSNISLMEEIGVSQSSKFNEIFRMLGHFYVMAQNESLHNTLHSIIRDSGFLRYMLKSKNPILTTSPIRQILDKVASLDKDHTWKLDKFFEYLEKLKEHKIQLKAGVKLEQHGKVQILTVHSAKGLEYEIVYIPFATDNVWGKGGRSSFFKLPADIYGVSASKSKSDDEDDERRLFFVALTRAKSSAVISHATQTVDGKPTILSRFVSSIKPEFLDKQVIKESDQIDLGLEGELPDDSKLFLDFVRSSFEFYGLSVSALNNYLQCPWKYFYVNLVRVPAGKEKSLMFGNAIHSALTMFFTHLKDTGEKSCEYLLSSFEKSASREDFTIKELGDVLVRGKEILTNYFREYESSFSSNVRVKYRIPEARFSIESKKVDLSTPAASDATGSRDDTHVKLTGEIDLIEFLDNSLQNVNVVDFKTGRARSRNDILGETESFDGNYMRQLIFYKLLLSIAQPKWNMKHATLDFVEADKLGKMHKESFEIGDEELSELENTIVKVSSEIQSLSFWDKKCEDKDCQWCALRSSLAEKQFENG